MSALAKITSERRAGWRLLIAGAVRLAERVIKTDGVETEGASEFAHAVGHTGKVSFAADGSAVAAGTAAAFLIMARQMLNAQYAARRLLVAPALLELARACDALLTEAADRDATAWKRHTGED